MAKVKRANHRSGTERPRWTLSGTVDEPGADEADWDPEDVHATGMNGHSGPQGQVSNGRPVQAVEGKKPSGQAPNGQAGHNGASEPGDKNDRGQKMMPQRSKGQDDPEQDKQGGLNGQDGQVPQDGQDREGQDRAAEFGTPVRVDEIAVAAMALSEDLHAATRGLPESVESRQFRRALDEAADKFRTVASELETTAGNLIRLAANASQTCGVTWGICPDHGLSLMNVGDVVTCHVLGCHREQEDVVERCTQPVAYRVVDAAGPAVFTCAGHAIACRLHLDGAVITLASDSLELL